MLKKAFYTYEDNEGVERLEIGLELNDGIDLPDENPMQTYATQYVVQKNATL